jgi:hypothetical protein
MTTSEIEEEAATLAKFEAHISDLASIRLHYLHRELTKRYNNTCQ